MNTMKCLGRTVIRTAVIWGVVFGVVPPGGAQEKAKAQEDTKKTEAAARVPGTPTQTLKTVESPARAAEEPSGGPHEGIKVHGHWSITIRNEDGSVASHHEFNNSLNDGSFLSKLLSRDATVPANAYAVLLNLGPGLATAGDGICSLTRLGLSIPFGCAINEGPGTSDGTSFYGLTAKAVNGSLVLSGSAKAANPGRISLVTTAVSYCPAGSSCLLAYFTKHDLTLPDPPSTAPPPPINVVPNQTIDVTVTISFS
jgi:hypothetical protein